MPRLLQFVASSLYLSQLVCREALEAEVVPRLHALAAESKVEVEVRRVRGKMEGVEEIVQKVGGGRDGWREGGREGQ